MTKKQVIKKLEEILYKKSVNNGSYHKDQRSILKELKEYVKQLKEELE